MDTKLEELIETVVKELKSDHPDILLLGKFLEMVSTISILSNVENEDAIKAARYFISLMQSPELFVSPSKNNPSVGLMPVHFVGK